MSSENNSKTIGADATCDLTLEHTSLSPVHARLELAKDGLVSISEVEPEAAVFLNREGAWVRVRRVILCVGDRIRLGQLEIPLQRLTALLGDNTNARLETISPALQRRSRGFHARGTERGGHLNRPRRNPLTGKIEEKQTGRNGWPNE